MQSIFTSSYNDLSIIYPPSGTSNLDQTQHKPYEYSGTQHNYRILYTNIEISSSFVCILKIYVKKLDFTSQIAYYEFYCGTQPGTLVAANTFDNYDEITLYFNNLRNSSYPNWFQNGQLFPYKVDGSLLPSDSVSMRSKIYAYVIQ